MAQPGEVPNFKGDESPEEADQWLEAFIRSTGSFSDAGIFRLLGRRFPSGTLARDWFSSLDGSVKVSWEAFEQAFHSRWIETTERILKQRSWNAFAHHTLSDDAIFSGKEFNYEDSSSVLHQWVEEHLRLGQATDSDNGILVKTTWRLLPCFVQAYLHAYFQGRQFSDINDLCSELSSIPSQLLLLEHTRRQLAPMEKILSMEKQMNIMAEKMDKIMNVVDQIGLSAGGPSHSTNLNDSSGHLSRSNDSAISSNESIDWEQCSPLTSVVSISDPASTALSEVSTPIAPILQLANPNEDQLVVPDGLNNPDTAGELATSLTFHVSNKWRKPDNVKSRNELIGIAREEKFAARKGNTSNVYDQQLYIFSSAVAIFDGLTGSKLRLQGEYWRVSGSYGICYEILNAIDFVHVYCTHKWYDYLTHSNRYWSGITSQTNSNATLVKFDQARFNNDSDQPRILIQGQDSIVSRDFLGQADISWAVCYYHDSSAYAMTSIQTILFMTLSSYLAECTGESKYIEAAVSAANCVKTWMLDSETSLIKDRMLYIHDAQEVAGSSLSCHLTGLAIEGFTVLAS
ncbi:hypothetical protein FRC03_012728, partial [Tulasnella sp. 419]